MISSTAGVKCTIADRYRWYKRRFKFRCRFSLIPRTTENVENSEVPLPNLGTQATIDNNYLSKNITTWQRFLQT
jgi:hypothetical protein